MNARDANTQDQHQRGLLFAIASVVLVSIAQLAMKFGMAHVLIAPHFEVFAALSTVDVTSTLLPLLAGIICYGISVLCWMSALGRLPLSLAYPLLSLSYPLVYLGAALLPFFHEPISAQRLAGIGLIMIGVALLMLKTKNTTRTPQR